MTSRADEPSGVDETPEPAHIGELPVIAAESQSHPVDVRSSGSRRRPWLGWVVALGVIVVVALGVVGWFAGEQIARAEVISQVQRNVAAGTGLDPRAVRVELPEEPILPQLISGKLSMVRIEADGVSVLGSFTGDVEMLLTGVATGEGEPIDRIEVDVTVPTEGFIAGFLADSELDPSNVSVTPSGQVELARTLDLGIFGEAHLVMAFDLSVTPAGEFALHIVSLRLGDLTFSRDDLAEAPIIGEIAEQLLQPIMLCVADQFPPGVLPSELQITPGSIRLGIAADDIVLTEDLLSERGSCS